MQYAIIYHAPNILFWAHKRGNGDNLTVVASGVVLGDTLKLSSPLLSKRLELEGYDMDLKV